MGIIMLLLFAVGSFIVSVSITFAAVCAVKAASDREPKRYGFGRPAEPATLPDRAGMGGAAAASVDGAAALDNFRKG